MVTPELAADYRLWRKVIVLIREYLHGMVPAITSTF
jgi:hypothetical protein